jgi:predicted N-formylglutamate amidohydrolase
MSFVSLLQPDESDPVLVANPSGSSDFLLACDHAGRLLPRRLGTLGLPDSEMRRHIGWDIGIWAVTQRLSTELDALAIGQRYSRLAIDCNRTPGVPSSIPQISESTRIPGNADLSQTERDARERELFRPYHDRLAAELDRRADRPTLLVAMHSFTPVYLDVPRPWHAGVLFNRDDRLARIILDLLRAEPGLVVGENEPYAVSDLTDYTVPVHAERRGLAHVELEIRQDLIADAVGQARWADLLARLLPAAAERLALAR